MAAGKVTLSNANNFEAQRAAYDEIYEPRYLPFARHLLSRWWQKPPFDA